jgi:hypothetical protein
MSGQHSAPAALPPGKSFGAHEIGGWVDPIARLCFIAAFLKSVEM